MFGVQYSFFLQTPAHNEGTERLVLGLTVSGPMVFWWNLGMFGVLGPNVVVLWG